jgi:hypothetical protein
MTAIGGRLTAFERMFYPILVAVMNEASGQTAVLHLLRSESELVARDAATGQAVGIAGASDRELACHASTGASGLASGSTCAERADGARVGAGAAVGRPGVVVSESSG